MMAAAVKGRHGHCPAPEYKRMDEAVISMIMEDYSTTTRFLSVRPSFRAAVKLVE